MLKSKQFIFIALLVASCLTLLFTNIGKTNFSTSVIDLLPGKDNEAKILRELAVDSQGKQLTVRLFSDSSELTENAVTAFEDSLGGSREISHVWRTGQKGLQDVVSLLFQNRYFWLLPDWTSRQFPDLGTHESIQANELAEKIVQLMENYLESPEGMMLVDVIPRDPLLLMDGLERRLPVSESKDNGNEVFLWVEQTHSPFSDAGQRSVFDVLNLAAGSAREIQPALQMEFTGVSSFAYASKLAIKSEIQRLNFLGIICVLLISVIAVRSLNAMARITAVVLIALLVAATTVVSVFDSVHVIALVIGSILTGIAVDYGFHLILTEDDCIPDTDTRKAVIAGSLSSAMGFLVLMGAPLPFLRQVGVFVGSGLIAALLVALLLQKTSSRVFPVRAWKLSPNSLSLWIGLLMLLLTLPGLLRLSWESNINDLEYPLPQLKELDARLQESSTPISTQFTYMVFAEDILTARQQLEEIDSTGKFIHAGLILPGYDRVKATQDIFNRLEEFPHILKKRLEEQDYYPEAFEPFFSDWQAYLNLEITESLYQNKLTAFSQMLPGPLRNLVHTGKDLSWFLIFSETELDISSNPHLIYLDQSHMLSKAFGEYAKVMWIFTGVCLIVLVISVCLYFRLRPGLAALVVPAAACIMAFGIIGYWHHEVGLFHLVGALLAFCISLDYGLFAVTSRNAGRKLPKSITISCITTLAVFGILASSQVPAVRQLALTILLILGCTVIVILIRWPGQRRIPLSPFELIPHGPAARMVEKILHADGHSIQASCNPHIHQAMPSECLIEAMAQCAALLLAKNNSSEIPRSGMLVIVQSSTFFKSTIFPGQFITANVDIKSDTEEGLMLFEGNCVDDQNHILTEAKFSIFIPPADPQSV